MFQEAHIMRLLENYHQLTKINITYIHKDSMTIMPYLQPDLYVNRSFVYEQVANHRHNGCFDLVDCDYDHYILKVMDRECFLVGPFITKRPEFSELSSIKQTKGLNVELKVLFHHYQSLRLISSNQHKIYRNLINIMVKSDLEDFESDYREVFDHEENENTHVFKQWQYNIDVKALKYNQRFYEEFYDSENIENLNKVLYKYYFISEPFEILFSNTEVSKTRWLQNLLINSTAFTFDEGVRRGIPIDVAVNLLIHYNYEIETCHDYDQLLSIRVHMLKAFFNAYRRTVIKHENPLIKHIKHYIDDHINQAIQVAEIAESLGYNKEYISSQFKISTGVSIIGYINKKKIELAADILLNTTDKVLDIASYLGFSNSSSFIRTFKNIKGITPNDYRKQRME